MKLYESDTNWNYKYYLPGLRLPNPDNPVQAESKKSKNTTLQEIKSLVKDMKKNDYCTTNFAIIVYLIEYKHDSILLSNLLPKIKQDFNLKKKIFLNSRTKKPFECEKNLIRSVSASISRNKSFIVNKVDKGKLISLNPSKALEYLNKMYKKYTSDNSDIASISSRESNSKSAYQSEKKVYNNKKFLGNKTIRKKNKKKYNLKEISFDSLDSVERDEKSHSTYKFLKDNLKEKSENINDINQINKKDDDEIIFNIDKDNDIFAKEFSSFNDNTITKFVSNSLEVITNSINASNETKKIISSYKKNLESVKAKIEEREQNSKKYEEYKNNIKNIKQDLNTLYQVYQFKLEIMNDTKKLKCFDKIFDNSKQMEKLYKELSEEQIEKLINNMNDMRLLEKDIFNKNKEIVNDIKIMKITDNGNVYFGKNEIKKDYNNLCKTIKEDNKNIEFCDGKEFNDKNSEKIVKDITKKFNNITKKIFEGKNIEIKI